MRLAGWFKGYLFGWALGAIPVMIIGFGFSGGSISFDMSLAHPIDIILFLMVWTLIISPVFLAPFAIKRTRVSDSADEVAE
jgi:hypothetical protein